MTAESRQIATIVDSVPKKFRSQLIEYLSDLVELERLAGSAAAEPRQQELPLYSRREHSNVIDVTAFQR
jgi:hypothetical protein